MDSGATETDMLELENRLLHPSAEPISLPLSFLKSITRDFCDEGKLGSGGYGVVYKGILQHRGLVIAVKKIHHTHLVEDNIRLFQKEVTSLMRIGHQNIVKLLGYCAESRWETMEVEKGKYVLVEIPARMLCFEYLCNEGLDKHLTDESSGLEWNTRYQIIKGVCNGLNFLHERGIVHLDLKPQNILMDATMMPKIADFGLSRLLGKQKSYTVIVTSNRAGTLGYMAPEYINKGEISKKADVFSLGVIIIEILKGCKDGYPDYHQNTETEFQHFTEKVLNNWRNRFERAPKYPALELHTQIVKQCIEIALKCVHPDKEKRPTVSNIIELLNAAERSFCDQNGEDLPVDHQIRAPDVLHEDGLMALNNFSTKDHRPAWITEGIMKSAVAPLQPQRVPVLESVDGSLCYEVSRNASFWVAHNALASLEDNVLKDWAATINLGPAVKADPTGKATTTQEDLSSFYEEQMEKLFLKRKNEFNDDRDAELMKTKMHRYPPSIQDLGDWCTVPKVVAIGPYYRHHDKLKPAEKVKRVAAHHCIKKSDLSVREMYQAVISVAVEIDARGLYDKDVMEGIDDETDFLPMMFYDACFLVMYMLKRSLQKNYDAVLFDFFESNDTEITHDIMLLENQIPWPVVDAIRKKMKAGHFLEEFIANWKDGCLLDRVGDGILPPIEFDEDYEPPHLLGLLRFYTVGTRTRKINGVSDSDLEKIKSLQIPAGAIELAEMGIHLTANEATALADMGLARKWIIFAELSMAPLSLDASRASLLVNMAALELCTTPDFLDTQEDGPKFDDTAVCSYLLLLCTLMHKKEDVHELRTKGILQGGAGLTNKKALDFFTSLQSLRRGRCYSLIMVQILIYRSKRPWITVYAFLYRNLKIILAIGFAIGFFGILKTLESLKGAHH